MGKVCDVYIPRKAKQFGKPAFAFIRFADSSSSYRVIVSTDGMSFLGRRIVVRKAKPQFGPYQISSNMHSICSPFVLNRGWVKDDSFSLMLSHRFMENESFSFAVNSLHLNMLFEWKFSVCNKSYPYLESGYPVDGFQSKEGESNSSAAQGVLSCHSYVNLTKVFKGNMDCGGQHEGISSMSDLISVVPASPSEYEPAQEDLECNASDLKLNHGTLLCENIFV